MNTLTKIRVFHFAPGLLWLSPAAPAEIDGNDKEYRAAMRYIHFIQIAFPFKYRRPKCPKCWKATQVSETSSVCQLMESTARAVQRLNSDQRSQ
jgi:hypothetical protein